MPVHAGYWLGERLATDLLDGGTAPPVLLAMSYEEAVETAGRWLDAL